MHLISSIQFQVRSVMDSRGSAKRLISLDAFRGATIMGMILVNDSGNGPAGYAQLRHSAWNGLTIADVVFPFFLFIVGVAMTFSLSARKERGENQTRLIFQILKRSAIIFALGLFLNLFPAFHFSVVRIPGVLQRVALCYLFASLIVLRNGVRGQVSWLVALLLSYWLLMALVPVPGIGVGVYEPGENFSAYVDSLLLSEHMWGDTETWDPEGVVSTLPAIATTLFGVLAGCWLRSGRSREEKTAWMFVAGHALLLLGLIVGIWLPINKSIWTSSFSICTAGWALIGLGMFYWIIDVQGCRKWAGPLVMYGANSIAIYVLAGILEGLLRVIPVTYPDGTEVSLRRYIFRHFFQSIASPSNASLLFGLAFALVLLGVAWVMWKKGWFVRI